MMIIAAWLGEMVGLALAAASDVRDRIIPDRIVLLLVANGLLLRLSIADWRQVAVSLLAAGVVLLLLGQAAHFGLIGGGDAKLIAAVAVFVPAADVPALVLAIALAGGVVSFGYLAMRAMARHGAILRPLRREQSRIAAGLPLPYALAIFLGTGWLGVADLLRCFSATRCSF
jgi:prepilin peptidase CpaA